MTRYADILIAQTLPNCPDLLTYEVGEIEDLAVGEGVAVEMGNRSTKFYTGIVWRIHQTRPDSNRIRPILKRLYSKPLLSEPQRKFWEWIAEYYLCSLNDVMRIALPSLIQPVQKDEEAFEMAEYTPSEELYIGIEEPKEVKLRGNLEQIYREIITLANGKPHIARRLIESTSAQLRSLESKGLITLTKRARVVESATDIAFTTPTLTPHQAEAVEQIRKGYDDHLCALLFGVTGSGKTEVYINLIGEQLAAGRDVLMLVPEIALTTQLKGRLESIFGSRVTTIHSQIPRKRRTEIFMHLAQSFEGGNFVIGARSAIFTPLHNLGLIIVDEEHDASYKQIDPAPRYNARDAAHILASLYGAKTLLGSATPSLESWTNAITGKFALSRLTERYGEAELPQIVISDTRRAAKRRERVGHFNRELLQRIESRVAQKEQVMLFQNRRGFAPYVECGACGWVARCPHCNVSLTLHKSGQTLRCHYCEYSTPLPTLCPSCSTGEVRAMGFGTEKIEEQISEYIPSARTVRMDRDTASSATALERIVESFARGESDIMVGTQMIAKGFDFSNVTLVGILNADNMLLNPDFRAEERAYALITQVAGRAGRRAGVDAEVVIQTSQPTHRVIKYAGDGDYEAMARELLSEREAFFYPPYSRITMITLQHSDRNLLYASANALSTLLRGRFGRRVKGPVPPPIDRIRGEWRVSFMLKIESGASSQRARTVLRECIAKWRDTKEFNAIILSCNVDPQ